MAKEKTKDDKPKRQSWRKLFNTEAEAHVTTKTALNKEQKRCRDMQAAYQQLAADYTKMKGTIFNMAVERYAPPPAPEPQPMQAEEG